MNQHWNAEQDRRRFFRINDVVGLAYRPADASSTEKQQQTMDVQNSLKELDDEIGGLLVQLRREQPLAAEALACMNRKLQILARRIDSPMAGSDDSAAEYQQTSVNISACGIAFLVDQPYSAGSRLQLDLLLRPGDWELRLIARIIACDPVMAGWQLRLDYESISQSDQDLLVRHMLVKQSQQLRR